jgi:hypothetical protein
MRVERLLPADAVRPIWSSSSMLVYVGGLVALLATTALIAIAGEDGGRWAALGAAVVAAAVAFALAELLARADRAIAAGVAATLALLFAVGALGVVLDLVGAFDLTLDDWQPASLVLEAGVVGGAFLAVRRYRAPLLVLPAAVAVWVAIADLGSLVSWGDAEELLSLGVGAVLAAAGVALDRAGRPAYAFWLHTVGALAVGGAVVALAGDSGWPVVAAIALLFVAAAFALRRSSYAVLGAIGILVAATLFAVDPIGVVAGVLPFAPPSGGDSLEGWQVALSYLVAGLLLAAIGVAGRLWRLPRSGPVAAGE